MSFLDLWIPKNTGFFRYGVFHPGTGDTQWSWIFITGHEDFYPEVFLSWNQGFLRPWDFYHGNEWFFRCGNFYSGHWKFFWSGFIPQKEHLLTGSRLFYLEILIPRLVLCIVVYCILYSRFLKSSKSFLWMNPGIKDFYPWNEDFFLATVFFQENGHYFKIGQASPSFELSPVPILNINFGLTGNIFFSEFLNNKNKLSNKVKLFRASNRSF